MTLGVYTNNYIPQERYAIKENSSQYTNADTEGHPSFFEEFAQDTDNKQTVVSDVETENSLADYYTSPSFSKINDYMDNFLLLNAEQVACANMTQHLIRSDELKETLGFLNTQAAKNMFVGRKRPNFAEDKKLPQFKNTANNFFSTGIDSSTNNFFIK